MSGLGTCRLCICIQTYYNAELGANCTGGYRTRLLKQDVFENFERKLQNWSQSLNHRQALLKNCLRLTRRRLSWCLQINDSWQVLEIKSEECRNNLFPSSQINKPILKGFVGCLSHVSLCPRSDVVAPLPRFDRQTELTWKAP